jgi:spermidine synthase
VTLPSREVALLYGMNVIGGALGALACGFVLIWKLGVTGTALAAFALAAGVGGSALGLARSLGAEPAAAPAEAPPAPRGRLGVHAGLALLVGAYALSYELLWGRMAKLYLGDRTMATATLLFIYLACMALGSFAVHALFARRPPMGARAEFAWLARVLALAAPAHLASLGALVHVIESPTISIWVAQHTALRVAVAFAVTALPVTLLGMAFPLLLQTARQVDTFPARAVGRLYFINSLGSAGGAIFGGYLAPRSVGTLDGFLITSLAAALTAGACQWGATRDTLRRWLGAGAIAALLALGWALAPPDLLFHDSRDKLVASHEDEYGIQLLTSDADGHLKLRNNRIYIAYKLGARATSFAQETMAYFACLLSSRCESVLNIGTGYGITAGAFTTFAELRELTTVEMLPWLCRIQPTFERYNFAFYADPRTRQLCTDGRRVVAAGGGRWDVISVNVLDPYLPGSAQLFTTDFWRLARRHLAPGGVYSQLVWGADRDLLVRGLESVFERVLLLPAYTHSFHAVAFADDAPPALHLERLTPRMQAALAALGLPRPAPFFEEAVRQALIEQRTRDAARQAPDRRPLHTDDHPILEYRWSHGDPTLSMFDSLQAHEMR